MGAMKRIVKGIHPDVYIENGETRDIQFWRENGEKQQLSKIKDNKRIDIIIFLIV